MLVANPIAEQGDVASCIGTVDAMSRSASTFAHTEITESPIQLVIGQIVKWALS